MILAAHQPDLLPWTGFWHKMDRADVFDVAIHDQFQSRGYQRRVLMRGSWASIPLVGKPTLCPISEVRIREEAPDVLIRTIVGRYRGARYWKERGDALVNAIDESRAEHLWMFNLGLLVRVRAMLGIETPLAIAMPPVGAATDGLLNLCAQYGATTYLSGTGGRQYMGENPEARFARQRIDLEWSRHEAVTGESIVTVLMDYSDPLAVVRRFV